jgi:type VII secretion-associated protein (TIGR03931 family)
VTRHRSIIEVGPENIRRLCCGTSTIADAEMRAALEAIDDHVALVYGSPVAVDSLWRTLLQSLRCEGSDGMTVVHPSWWPPSRVGVIAAAPELEDVEAQPRSWLLTRLDTDPDVTVVVEIADRLVAVAGAGVAAVPRTMRPTLVAREVASLVAATMRAVVVIDAPVPGAAALATSIAEVVRDDDAQTVIEIDDARLRQLARRASQCESDPDKPLSAGAAGGSCPAARRLGWLAAAGVVAIAAVPALNVMGVMRGHEMPDTPAAAMTFLVEGQVVLTVPANWPTQRLVGGPGSARVQVTSPSEPEVALHITQSAIVGETLSRTAERLKRAIDAEPAGAFVDFNPYGTSAGRPAVTYREMRSGHQVRWTVLIDGGVRISIGCQSRTGAEDAVREICEQAVRSAHAISGGTKSSPQGSE